MSSSDCRTVGVSYSPDLKARLTGNGPCSCNGSADAQSQASAKDEQIGGDHYRSMAIQPADYILANNLGWVEGCVIKYVSRWQLKGGVEDLRKARHFLDLLIEHVERQRAG